MFLINSRNNRFWSALLVYLTVGAATAYVASVRLRTNAEQASFTPGLNGSSNATTDSKPFFSLSTHRTYGTAESARVWLDYRGLDNLDFRVYRIEDPTKFFAQLTNPHQIGEDENEEIATTLSSHPSPLERMRSFKAWAYSGIKSYVRSQLRLDARKIFNDKFRSAKLESRQPLNVADYARVPILNPNQLVTRWREPLPPLENQYDQRVIPLGKRGAGVYLVEAAGGDLRAYTVVVVTDLAMVQKTSRDGELAVYTVDRKTGEPRPNSHVQIVKARKVVAMGTTDAQGLLRTRIAMSAGESTGDAEPEVDNNDYIVLASDRDQFAISDLESFYFRSFDNEEGEQNIRGYIYTDRPIYRPNHTVYFKGILRALDEQGRYHALKSKTVTVTVSDPNDAKVFEKEIQLSTRGTFDGELILSEEAPLGRYQIEAQTDEGSSSGAFQVAEYKKPEYKVTVATPKRFVPAGSKTSFSIEARYFFGAPVSGAEVQYYVYRSRYYPSYNGESDDEMQDPADEDEYSQYTSYESDMVLDGEGKLDASGHLEVNFDIPASDEASSGDFQYRLEAQVTDSARRTIEGAASLVATRGNVIARAIPDRYVYTVGQTAALTITTTDYEGHPVPAKLSLKFVERTWTKVDRNEDNTSPGYELHERELSSVDINTDQQGHGRYEYAVSTPGNITVKTLVKEGAREVSSVGGYIWVTSRDLEWSDSSYYSENYAAIKLVPDKKSYRPGDVAHVLAILPDENTNLLVTTELMSVMSASQVRVPGKSAVLDIPIEANYAPNVFLNVTYVKKGDMYTSDQRLVVPATDKMLNLEIIPNKKEYKPREAASYTILARDQKGSPVADAEVSLGVVDEAIYSISPDYSGSIRQEFYGMRYNEVETRLSISYTFTGYAGEKPLDLARNKPSYQLADFKNEGDLVQPTIRKQFKDTAYWQPSAVTGSDGRATVRFRLPDNLTTWRATARGVTSDTKVGFAQSKVVARKDVILRLETPRFLTQGDTVTLSGVVHNYLKYAKSTQISISVSGAQILNGSQQTVIIPPQGEHRVDWRVTAPQTGEIKLLAKALTNTESDAVELDLDVVPRGLRESKNEAWSTSDESADQQFSIDLPGNADQNSRKLRIEVAPTVAGTLFGALDYLTTYPYGCTEQTMSSFLPNIIVSRALNDVKTASIRNPDELKKKAERGRDRLYAFQHSDGGWGWWKNDQSDPFMTAYVVDGLTLARESGFEIDDERLERGRQQLQSMLSSGKTEAGTPIDSETRAFMIYALAESGVNTDSLVGQLFTERNSLQPYGRALLALTLKLRKMENRALEVANEIENSASSDSVTAHWESKRKAMLDFAEEDDTEATALSLKALAQIRPESKLMPRAARWLVSERRNGYYWNSTKNTAFAIFGLIDYVKASHELSPDYDVEVYLNGETVIAEHIRASSATKTLLITRKGTSVGSANQIRVVKRGKGSLFFSSAVEYYTDDEVDTARSSGELQVEREYQRLSVQQDGYKLKWVLTPLNGEIHSGDLIVVKLRLTGRKARHLMLEDPIPAGAEQLDSIGNLNLDYTDRGWTDWYSSREFRDRRTVFFLDYFDGDVTLQYAMRVQIPGEFVVAPARAELMYTPEIYSNTTGQRFSFLDRVSTRQ